MLLWEIFDNTWLKAQVPREPLEVRRVADGGLLHVPREFLDRHLDVRAVLAEVRGPHGEAPVEGLVAPAELRTHRLHLADCFLNQRCDN
eukprot:11709261-Heterocapsa_arctica.AAC.1